MATRRSLNQTKDKAADQPSTAAQGSTAPAPEGNNKNDARIGRLEKQVADLHALLHEHGIRHKAAEPATAE